MLQFLKKFSASIFITVLIAFGLKYFIEIKLELKLNELIVKSSPYAKIRFDAVHIDFRGKIDLTNLTVQPKKTDSRTYHINNLSLTFPDILYMYQQGIGLGDTSMPKRLSINLEGLEMAALDNILFQELLGEYTKQHFKPVLAPSCGDPFSDVRFQKDVIVFQGNSLINLGLQYNFHPFSQEIDIVMDSELPGIGFTNLTARVNNLKDLSLSSLNDSLEISELTFSYLDDGYLSRMVTHCSLNSNISIAQYANNESSKDNQYYIDLWGIIPNKEIRMAYSDFLENPESIYLSAALPAGFITSDLSKYSQKDWAAVLNINLNVNDQSVTPLQFDMVSPAFLAFIEKNKTQKIPAPSEADTENNPAARQVVKMNNSRDAYTGNNKKFRPIELSELSDYIEKPICIEVLKGRIFEGVLISLDDEKVMLKTSTSGGHALLPIKLSRIKSAQVKI